MNKEYCINTSDLLDKIQQAKTLDEVNEFGNTTIGELLGLDPQLEEYITVKFV